jgi:hypothetical protein
LALVIAFLAAKTSPEYFPFVSISFSKNLILLSRLGIVGTCPVNFPNGRTAALSSSSISSTSLLAAVSSSTTLA